MRNFLFIIVLLGISLSANSAVRTSVNNGTFINPLTWDCSCVPSTTDDIVVNHNVTQNYYIQVRNITVKSGASYNALNYQRVVGNVDVESGATLYNQYYIFIFGNYNIDGTHSADNYILIEGENTELSGTGTVNLASWLTLRNGAKSIKSGTDLTLPNGYGIYMWTNTTTVTNNGKVTLINLGGINSSSWVNAQNSILDFKRGVFGNYSLITSATNNEVIYSGNNQTIHNTIGSTYYDLTLSGSNTSFKKNLSSDVVILNDLFIESTEFNANNFNTEIRGDWTNIDGVHNPTATRVTFSGVNQEISTTSGTENFFNLNLNSSQNLRLNTALVLGGTLSSSTNLFAQGNRIDITGDWVNNGNFIHGNNIVRMVNNGRSTLNGDTEFYELQIDKGTECENNDNVSIRSTLVLNDGTFITNDRVTFLSDINGTARLARIDQGTMTGDVNVQRYFPTTTNDWHLLGSPVQGTALSDWNDDLLTMGFPGSDYPSFYFNNATYYDETFSGHKDNGILNASDISDNINVGQGWRLYLPAEINTIDVKGPANLGVINIPLTYTNSGSPLDDGWNLIANPYISTIDWSTSDGWLKSGLNDAVYVWNPSNSQYTTYVGGIGTNGGSKFIPSTQAFWVQTNNVSPSLQILENAKVTNDVAFKNNLGKNDYFKIVVVSDNGFSDEVAIRTSLEANDDFDPNLDALELSSPAIGVPGICIQGADEKDYSVFSYSHGPEEKWLPLGITVSESGNHKISFKNLDLYKEYSCLVLYDNLNEQTYLIEENTVLSFYFDVMENENRFTLKICPPLGQFTEEAIKSTTEESTSDVSLIGSDILINFSEVVQGDVYVNIIDMQGKNLYDQSFRLNNENKIIITENRFSGPVLVVVRNLNLSTTETKMIILK